MEPKVKSTGHGYYALYYWSYKDQVWKHLRGSQDISVSLRQLANYWKTFGAYISERLKLYEKWKTDAFRETKSHVIFNVCIDDCTLKVTLVKKNLLKINIAHLSGPTKDVNQRLIETIRKSVLEEDFCLTEQEKQDKIKRLSKGRNA